MKAFLDTHTAVILAEGNAEAFGRAAKDLLERSALFVSPVVRLELQLLYEIGRIALEPDAILTQLAADCGVTLANDPIQTVIMHAMPLVWTRDPFDRLLVATATLHRAPFITRDQQILEHFGAAVW
ncbi:MAG: type II toxin-antitoxin system VapC family toxin [bacterium]|nr:type II toxin-antitoxin system VapC family toxin [bacterium]